MIHKKGKENSNADALSRSSHMEDAPLIEDDAYAEFYEVEEIVIKYLEGINEIQHVQRNLGEISEEQGKDEVWSEVIKWVEKGKVPDKVEIRGKMKKTNSRGFLRWCFLTESKEMLRANTTGVDLVNTT